MTLRERDDRPLNEPRERSGRHLRPGLGPCGLFALVAVFALTGCNRSPPDTAVGTPAVAAQAEDVPGVSGDREKAAVAAAGAWLSLVDAGKYDDSWTEAASFFKRRIDQATWARMVGGVRGPLGALSSRSVKSARYVTKLPGAPDGEYVVVQYQARFENKAEGLETVTPMMDPDGRWRVSGYFIK